MKRPAYQYYPSDDVTDADLKRCSLADQGAWVRIKAVLHQNETEYGVRRWALADIARAAGVPLQHARALNDRNVLKGADSGAMPYIYTPRHAGRDGTPVTLVDPGADPCYYSARMVRDEYLRTIRGAGTRFVSDDAPKPPIGATPKPPIGTEPKPPIGPTLGDGASTSLSLSLKSKSKSRAARSTSLPDGFAISDRVREWAREKGFDAYLAQHLEKFIGSVKARGARYADWDAALMNCIRDDWGEFRSKANGGKVETATPAKLCGNCGGSREGGETRTQEKGPVCNSCWKFNQDSRGSWPKRAETRPANAPQ